MSVCNVNWIFKVKWGASGEEKRKELQISRFRSVLTCFGARFPGPVHRHLDRFAVRRHLRGRGTYNDSKGETLPWNEREKPVLRGLPQLCTALLKGLRRNLGPICWRTHWQLLRHSWRSFCVVTPCRWVPAFRSNIAIFRAEDGGSIFFRNVSTHVQVHTASLLRPPCTSSPPWEPQTLLRQPRSWPARLSFDWLQKNDSNYCPDQK
jgi:hypothetical protein